MRGQHGRLFLANDTNEVILQHSGERRFGEDELRLWRELLDARMDWLGELGIPYFFMVPPNAHSVYPEDLPEGIASAPERPVHQLMRHLGGTGSQARLMYPLDDMLAAKPDPLLYSRTDPHWSGRGAFVAYRRLLTEVEREVRLHRVPPANVRFVEVLQTGELGFKVEPEEESVEVYAQVARPQAWLLHDNLVVNVGKLIVTECPAAPDTTCVLLGDSFANHMLPFLAASFRRLVFAQIPTLDRALVLEERPDVVITLLNERFLIYVPHDAGGRSVHDYADAKLADGAVRREARFWPRRNPGRG